MAMNQPYRLASQDRHQHPLPGLLGRGLLSGIHPGGLGGKFRGPGHLDVKRRRIRGPHPGGPGRDAVSRGLPREFHPAGGGDAALVCAFSGLLPGPDCPYVRQELFIAGTEPTAAAPFTTTGSPASGYPPPLRAGCIDRFEQGGTGRFRLADFDPDLPKVFQAPGAASGSGVPVEPASQG